MENKAHATAAGAFVVLMLAFVIGAVLWFSRDRTVRVAYDIVTDQSVSGLSPQANVRLRGINVGRVASVAFMPGDGGAVRIRMEVDENAPVTTSTYATLNYQGVTGLVYVELSDDEKVPVSQRRRLEAGGWGDVPRIPLRSGLLATLSDRTSAVLDRAGHTMDLLDAWLAQGNLQATVATLQSIRQAADGIAQASTELTTATRPVLAEARATMASTRALADAAHGTLGRFGQSGGTLDQVDASARHLAAAAARLDGVTLPRIDGAMRSIDRAARSVDNFADTVSDQPQSLLFGPGARTPGPGEPGFTAPATTTQGKQP